MPLIYVYRFLYNVLTEFSCLEEDNKYYMFHTLQRDFHQHKKAIHILCNISMLLNYKNLSVYAA